MRTIVRWCFASACLVTIVACSERDPVADGAGNAAAAEIDVLPPDESVATPANALERDEDESAEAGGATIPASLHGRWGMTPGDCTSTRGDAKGLLVVSGDSLRFYESVARPSPGVHSSTDSVRGNFAFTGEGMNWTKFETLELQDGKLVRTESDPMTSYTYARCTG